MHSMHRADPPLPEPCSCHTPLYAGALVAIADWECAGADSHGEEWGGDDRVVVTRSGVWELEVEGETRLADPATAVLWNAGAYRVRHPVGGRDRCTIFRLTPEGRAAFSEEGAGKGGTFARRTRPIDGPTYLRHRRALERARGDRAGSDPLAIEEPALALLSALRGGEAGEDLPRGARRQVDRAREVIARDFAQPLTLAGIAAEAGCSPEPALHPRDRDLDLPHRRPAPAPRRAGASPRRPGADLPHRARTRLRLAQPLHRRLPRRVWVHPVGSAGDQAVAGSSRFFRLRSPADPKTMIRATGRGSM
jgi:hypothetical protein